MGTDELVGIVESIGPELQCGVISDAYLNERALYMWQPTKPLRLADLTSGTALIHGVTNELSTMTPYAVPQQWAAAFTTIAEGVFYRSRFDTRIPERAVAHFGPSGLSPRAKGRQQLVTADIRMRLTDEFGIQIAGPPSLSQLRVASKPSVGN
jgi:hypothetical protein